MAADFLAYLGCIVVGAIGGICLGLAFWEWYVHGEKSTT